MRRFALILGILAFCAGCGGPAASDPATPGLPPRPTATQRATAALAGADEPTPASDQAPTIIFQQTSDGSIGAITAAGQLLVLADPTTPGQRLPWKESPDGSTIAIVIAQGAEFKTGRYDSASLWTVRVDGSDPRELLDLGGNNGSNGDTIRTSDISRAIEGQQLAWTPDGKWIVVASAHEGQVDLYTVAADGSEVRRLTNTPDLEFGVALSPDGISMAYATTTSFGTGGGLGSPRAWAQSTTSQPRPLIGADPAGLAGVEIIGWLDNATALAASASFAENSKTIWRQTGDAAPEVLQKTALGGTSDLVPGRVAFTDPTDRAVYLWQGEPDGPARLDATASRVVLDPHANRLLICGGEGETAGVRSVWQDGKIRAIDEGVCDTVAWHKDWLALGTALRREFDGTLVDLAAGTQIPLPFGAKIAGWQGDNLYFFIASPGGLWSAQRINAAAGLDGRSETLQGSGLESEPTDPRLVIRR